MRWFRKLFRKDDEFETVSKDVPLTTLMRWYIYDTGMGHENEIAGLLGLTPVSEEGNKKERQDSELRLDKVLDLMPYLDFVSDVAADAVSSMQLKEMQKAGILSGKDELEEDISTMQAIYKAVAVSSLVGGFSIALQLGLVTNNAIASDIAIKNLGDEYGF